MNTDVRPAVQHDQPVAIGLPPRNQKVLQELDFLGLERLCFQNFVSDSECAGCILGEVFPIYDDRSVI